MSLFTIWGIVKGFGGFFKNNWKLIAIVGALVAGIYYHQKAVVSFGNERYLSGASDALAKVKDQIAAKDRENREKEQALDEALKKFDAVKAEEDRSRNSKEDKLAQHANNIIANTPFIDVPQCSVTKDVLIDRNAIRALGPKI